MWICIWLNNFVNDFPRPWMKFFSVFPLHLGCNLDLLPRPSLYLRHYFLYHLSPQYPPSSWVSFWEWYLLPSTSGPFHLLILLLKRPFSCFPLGWILPILNTQPLCRSIKKSFSNISTTQKEQHPPCKHCYKPLSHVFFWNNVSPGLLAAPTSM